MNVFNSNLKDLWKWSIFLLACITGLIYNYCSFPTQAISELLMVVSKLVLKLFQLVGMPYLFFSLLSGLLHLRRNKHLNIFKTTLIQNFSIVVSTLFIGAAVAFMLVEFILPLINIDNINENMLSYQFFKGDINEKGVKTGMYENNNFLLNLVPSSFLEPFINPNPMQVILLALLIFISTDTIDSIGDKLNSQEELNNEEKYAYKLLDNFLLGIEKCHYIFKKILEKIVWVVPYVASFFMFCFFAIYNNKDIIRFYFFFIICLVILYLCYLILFKIWLSSNKINNNLLTVIKSNKKAIQMAFFSSSSYITLDCLIDTLTDQKGMALKKRIIQPSLSIGSTFNMSGAVGYFLLTTILISKLHFGILTPEIILKATLWSLILSVVSPGIPESGFFLLLLFLYKNNIPTEYGIILIPMERIIDMMRTVLNVLGDIIVAIVLHNKYTNHLK